jgi:transposase
MPLRPYDQDQMFLLPPSLNEWIRQDHPARVFSEIIDKLDTSTFRQTKEEGRPAYHPKMMIKVILWGYATGIRSNRKIEERLEQDVVFM